MPKTVEAETPRIEIPDYLASLRLLLGHVGGSRGQLIAAVFLAILAAAFELVPIWAVYRIVTAVVASSAGWPLVLFHAVVAAAAVLCGFLIMGLALALSHVVAFDVVRRLRLALAGHMGRLPLGYFSDRRSGDAKRMVIDEPEKLEAVIAHGLPEGISAIVTWLAVTVWLFAVDWRMAIAAIFVTPLSFGLLSLAMVRGGKRAGDYAAASARMNASIVEYLAGMPAIKIFNRTGASFSETSDAVRDYAAVETAWARDYVPLGGTFFTLVLTNIVFILPVGLLLLHAGSTDLPTVLLFVILGGNYSQPLMKLFNQFHALAHISMGSMLIGETLGTKPQSDTGQRVELANHDIAFDKVSFRYGERQVLHDVTFTAKARTVTALVGASGSGKSTIASLIPRLRDVDAGSVKIGGVDVRDIGLEQLMDMIAYIFQDSFLFSDTIEANIRFGDPAASDEEVEAAAKAARAHDFIMALPEGYATRLGEQGRSLSGGERQRIAIARAILKNAPIVVLDEATAFADPDNEAAIQEAIAALTADRTLIVVAHRLHTVTSGHLILVIDGGGIAEQGQHGDLIAEGGLYARLWRDYNQGQAIALRPGEGAKVSEISS